MSQKTKRILSIIFQCAVVCLLVAALLYFTTWPTRADLTLDAVMLDAQGNELGTEQIRMKGYRLDYLFRESRMRLQIEPFGDLNYVSLTGNDRKHSVIQRFDKDLFGTEYLSISFYGGDRVLNDVVLWEMYFTEEMDRFAIWGHAAGQDSIYYAASVSGNYTTQEIMEYFSGVLPGF